MKKIRAIIIVISFIILSGSQVFGELTIHAHNNFISRMNLRPSQTQEALVVITSQWGYGLFSGDAINSIFNFKAQEAPRITQPPLFYPSPFKMTDPNVFLGYELNHDMEIDLRIYDIRGNEIYRKIIAKGDAKGGRGIPHYNKVPFGPKELGSRYMPAGVYFYLLINDNKVLGRGKFAVLP